MGQKIRRAASSVNAVSWKDDPAIKGKLSRNMKEIKKARRLSNTGLVSFEDARSVVERSLSGSLFAQAQVRDIRETNSIKKSIESMPAESGYQWIGVGNAVMSVPAEHPVALEA